MEAALLPHSGGGAPPCCGPVPADGVNASVIASVIGSVVAGERWSVLVFWVLNGAEWRGSEGW